MYQRSNADMADVLSETETIQYISVELTPVDLDPQLKHKTVNLQR